jgi:hypothetical protein
MIGKISNDHLATARIYDCPIVTLDGKIRKYPYVRIEPALSIDSEDTSSDKSAEEKPASIIHTNFTVASMAFLRTLVSKAQDAY